MDFLSGILLAVTSFFGFGSSPEQPLPDPVVVVPAEQTADSVHTPELLAEPVVPTIEPEVVVESVPTTDALVATPEPAPVLETEMAGGAAKPVTQSVPEPVVAATPDIRTALVAGGCFWCVEADLEKTPGIIAAVSGYAGGTTENPTYKNYGSGGHREVVEVTYDANQISYEGVLIVTMKTTDPTDDDGTFGDRGDKYSSAFYYESAEQKSIIDALIAEVNANGPYDAPLAIDVEARPTFWEAEDNHQDYYKGTLTKLKYQFYRDGSGRTDFIQTYWGTDTSPSLPWRANTTTMNEQTTYAWTNYVKPDIATLEATLDATAFRVTQQDGTERAGTSALDKNWERGIYVDILSGEPLYSSRDKFDSGTGWPSFVAPITPTALTEHEDRKLFSVRTETRSAIADNHIGHVFTDGPADRGGLRYCMNGAALKFVAEADMEAQGYGDFLTAL